MHLLDVRHRIQLSQLVQCMFRLRVLQDAHVVPTRQHEATRAG